MSLDYLTRKFLYIDRINTLGEQIGAIIVVAAQLVILLAALFTLFISISSRPRKSSNITITRRSLTPFDWLKAAVILRLLATILTLVDLSLQLAHTRLPYWFLINYPFLEAFTVVSTWTLYVAIFGIIQNRVNLIFPLNNEDNRFGINYVIRSIHGILMLLCVCVCVAYFAFLALYYGFYVPAVAGQRTTRDLDPGLWTRLNWTNLAFAAIYTAAAVYFVIIGLVFLPKGVCSRTFKSIFLSAMLFLLASRIAKLVISIFYVTDSTLSPLGRPLLTPIITEVFNVLWVVTISFLSRLLKPVLLGLEDWNPTVSLYSTSGRPVVVPAENLNQYSRTTGYPYGLNSYESNGYLYGLNSYGSYGYHQSHAQRNGDLSHPQAEYGATQAYNAQATRPYVAMSETSAAEILPTYGAGQHTRTL